MWQQIQNTEYEVSTTGQIRNVTTKELAKIIRFGGYLMLNHVGFVHRLVAKAFIPNPNNYPEVNHKDENIDNNNVNNLEWCASKYNSNYGTHCKKISDALRGKKKLRADGTNWLSERNKDNYYGYKSKQAYMDAHDGQTHQGGFKNHKHSEDTKRKILETLKLRRNMKRGWLTHDLR